MPVPLPVVVVRVDGPFTALDRKLWLALVHIAFPNLEKPGHVHEVSIREVIELFRKVSGRRDLGAKGTLELSKKLSEDTEAAAGLLIFILCWNEYLFSVYLADNHAMTMPPFLAAQMSVREQQAGSDAEEWARLLAAIILMTAPLIACAGFAQRFLTRLSPWGRVQG